tara:strand:+ start:885 stop:2543 length:1659 start_codon:yes stop_codon:yes gene_type:complete
MSFWRGLAGGLQQADARRERQTAAQDRRDERTEARDYRDERDAIADNRYDTALASTQAAQAIADERNTELWNRGTEDREHELHQREIGSAIQMKGLFGPNAVMGSSGSSNPSSSPTVPSNPDEMRDAMINFGSWVGGEEALAEMTPEHQEFYNTMGSDPQASAGMMDFIESQSAQGNIVTVKNLPDIINLAGVVEGKGVEEYEALQNTLRRGTFNFKDTEAVVEGIRIMQGYSPETVVYAQTGVALPAQEPDKQFNNLVKMLPNEVHAEIDAATESGDTERVAALREVNGYLESTNDAVKNRAVRQAFALGVGVDLVDRMGIADNPYLPPLPQAEEPVVAEAVEAEAPAGGGLWPNTGPAGIGQKPKAGDLRLLEAVRGAETEEETLAVLEEAAARHPHGAAGVERSLSTFNTGDLGSTVEELLSLKGEEGVPSQPWESLASTARNMDSTVPPEVFGDGVRKPADSQEEAGAFMQVPNTRGENLRTNRVGPAPMGATSAPDRSLQDSQELTEILTNPAIPEDMKNEARAEFERLYGEGSAEAAIDMIMNKSQ